MWTAVLGICKANAFGMLVCISIGIFMVRSAVRTNASVFL
jgi:hypothetical protein